MGNGSSISCTNTGDGMAIELRTIDGCDYVNGTKLATIMRVAFNKCG